MPYICVTIKPRPQHEVILECCGRVGPRRVGPRLLGRVGPGLLRRVGPRLLRRIGPGLLRRYWIGTSVGISRRWFLLKVAFG